MASTQTRARLDPRRVVTCRSGKRSYDTYADAFDAAELQMLRGIVKPGCHITPYQCEDCRRFHLCNRVIVYLGPRRS